MNVNVWNCLELELHITIILKLTCREVYKILYMTVKGGKSKFRVVLIFWFIQIC